MIEKNIKIGPDNEKKALQILSEGAVARGNYANLALVHHTKEEFILDFILQFPTQTQLVSRIIFSPPHAKRLAVALADNVKRWESGPLGKPPIIGKAKRGKSGKKRGA